MRSDRRRFVTVVVVVTSAVLLLLAYTCLGEKFCYSHFNPANVLHFEELGTQQDRFRELISRSEEEAHQLVSSVRHRGISSRTNSSVTTSPQSHSSHAVGEDKTAKADQEEGFTAGGLERRETHHPHPHPQPAAAADVAEGGGHYYCAIVSTKRRSPPTVTTTWPLLLKRWCGSNNNNNNNHDDDVVTGGQNTDKKKKSSSTCRVCPPARAGYSVGGGCDHIVLMNADALGSTVYSRNSAVEQLAQFAEDFRAGEVTGYDVRNDPLMVTATGEKLQNQIDAVGSSVSCGWERALTISFAEALERCLTVEDPPPPPTTSKSPNSSSMGVNPLFPSLHQPHPVATSSDDRHHHRARHLKGIVVLEDDALATDSLREKIDVLVDQLPTPTTIHTKTTTPQRGGGGGGGGAEEVVEGDWMMIKLFVTWHWAGWQADAGDVLHYLLLVVVLSSTFVTCCVCAKYKLRCASKREPVVQTRLTRGEVLKTLAIVVIGVVLGLWVLGKQNVMSIGVDTKVAVRKVLVSNTAYHWAVPFRSAPSAVAAVYNPRIARHYIDWIRSYVRNASSYKVPRRGKNKNGAASTKNNHSTGFIMMPSCLNSEGQPGSLTAPLPAVDILQNIYSERFHLVQYHGLPDLFQHIGMHSSSASMTKSRGYWGTHKLSSTWRP